MCSAFGLIAPTGRLVFVGITTQDVCFSHPAFHKLEGTLLCSRNALPHDFPRIIKLIEDGQIDTQPWITHHLAFEDVVDGFEQYTRRIDDVEGRVEAYDLGLPKDLKHEFASLAAEESVAEELEALKKRVRGDREGTDKDVAEG